MEFVTISLSPWEEPGTVVVDNTSFADPPVQAVRACEHGICSGSLTYCLGKVLSGIARGALSKACFLCEYLLWSSPLNGRFVRSGFPPAHNAASRQIHIPLGVRLTVTGQNALAKKDLVEFHLFIVASGKLICLLNLFLKNKREVSYLVLFVECKSVSCAIF